jgi:hypothetical protein
MESRKTLKRVKIENYIFLANISPESRLKAWLKQYLSSFEKVLGVWTLWDGSKSKN